MLVTHRFPEKLLPNLHYLSMTTMTWYMSEEISYWYCNNPLVLVTQYRLGQGGTQLVQYVSRQHSPGQSCPRHQVSDMTVWKYQSLLSYQIFHHIQYMNEYYLRELDTTTRVVADSTPAVQYIILRVGDTLHYHIETDSW